MPDSSREISDFSAVFSHAPMGDGLTMLLVWLKFLSNCIISYCKIIAIYEFMSFLTKNPKATRHIFYFLSEKKKTYCL